MGSADDVHRAVEAAGIPPELRASHVFRRMGDVSAVAAFRHRLSHYGSCCVLSDFSARAERGAACRRFRLLKPDTMRLWCNPLNPLLHANSNSDSPCVRTDGRTRDL